MLFIFLGIGVVTGILILPGWIWARRTRPQSVWLLALAVPGLLVWLSLTMMHVGGQSLGNVVELFGIAVAAAIAAYAKFFFLDQRLPPPRGGTLALVLVVLTALALRLFTPDIPE